MHEPVTMPSGHSAEKEAILQWIKKRKTNPITRDRLTAEELIPNHAVKYAYTELYALKNKTLYAYYAEQFQAKTSALQTHIASLKDSFNNPKIFSILWEDTPTLWPFALICPLSGELLQHPSMTSAGHTYEEKAINTYLEDQSTDPINGEQLKNINNLVLNRSLEDLLKAMPSEIAVGKKTKDTMLKNFKIYKETLKQLEPFRKRFLEIITQEKIHRKKINKAWQIGKLVVFTAITYKFASDFYYYEPLASKDDLTPNQDSFIHSFYPDLLSSTKLMTRSMLHSLPLIPYYFVNRFDRNHSLSIPACNYVMDNDYSLDHTLLFCLRSNSTKPIKKIFQNHSANQISEAIKTLIADDYIYPTDLAKLLDVNIDITRSIPYLYSHIVANKKYTLLGALEASRYIISQKDLDKALNLALLQSHPMLINQALRFGANANSIIDDEAQIETAIKKLDVKSFVLLLNKGAQIRADKIVAALDMAKVNPSKEYDKNKLNKIKNPESDRFEIFSTILQTKPNIIRTLIQEESILIRDAMRIGNFRLITYLIEQKLLPADSYYKGKRLLEAAYNKAINIIFNLAHPKQNLGLFGEAPLLFKAKNIIDFIEKLTSLGAKDKLEELVLKLLDKMLIEKEEPGLQRQGLAIVFLNSLLGSKNYNMQLLETLENKILFKNNKDQALNTIQTGILFSLMKAGYKIQENMVAEIPLSTLEQMRSKLLEIKALEEHFLYDRALSALEKYIAIKYPYKNVELINS